MTEECEGSAKKRILNIHNVILLLREIIGKEFALPFIFMPANKEPRELGQGVWRKE